VFPRDGYRADHPRPRRVAIRRPLERQEHRPDGGKSLLSYLRQEAEIVHTDATATGWSCRPLRHKARRLESAAAAPPDGPGNGSLRFVEGSGETDDRAASEPSAGRLIDDWHRYVRRRVRIVNIGRERHLWAG